ncbi:histidine kinase [Streptomyces griseoviridis]|uniref:histidine kinase n=1 Tax=Streptomyces griseoviridis TaxID=45398 RepID=A0A3S9ZEQ9_STRGD|nr:MULTISPECIES: histidine kinase [Streptomyces]AZS86338.1 sensor histidine kinase [Streptomyces griseoviridis]MDH6700835.1 signal transduction histidine kinase [Streptomyces sp. MAA16]QCN86798.1 sensor histidine kinase [Streptomyces griseoviridis]
MGKSVRDAGRATRHLAVAAAMTFGLWLFTTVLLIAVFGTLLVVGAWLLPEAVLLVRRIAGAKRQLTARWTGQRIPEAYLPLTGTVRERVRTAVRDPGTRTDLRWMFAAYVYGVLVVVAVPLWPVALVVDGVRAGLPRARPLVLPLIVRLADLEADWSTALLKPSPAAQLSARVEELAATRADAIAAHGAELRRIERDLHDGAQANLVALSMRIGLAKRAYDRDPDTARRLLDEAQAQAEQALTELRHVVRGIHPPILTDRGLVGAVRALAAVSGLRVGVEVAGLEDDGVRAPAAVEAAAYFVIAEALTNAAKYSGAPGAAVRLERVRRGLLVRVADEGGGGADETAGSGLVGIRRRVAALDGTVEISSPPGGPTVVEARLPCVW